MFRIKLVISMGVVILTTVNCSSRSCENELVGWNVDQPITRHMVIKNEIFFGRDSVTWNAVEVSKETAIDYAKEAWTSTPRPVLSLIFDNTVSCDERRLFRKKIDHAYNCKMGFVCEELKLESRENG